MELTRASLLASLRDLDNSRAWGEFHSIYEPILRRFAMARGLSAALAEEVAQDCMGAMARSMPRFEYDPSRGRFRNWLRAMVENRIRTLLRSRAISVQATDPCRLDAAVSSDGGPEAVFDEIWMQEHLRQSLCEVQQEVEPKTFEAFRLYVLEEQPVEAVCRKLMINANCLYKIKWRITRRLAEKMRALTSPA